jgi:hypothetical protein
VAGVAIDVAAPGAESDQIDLVDGATLRGKLTQIAPRGYVAIQSPGEGARAIDWFKVKRVVIASPAGVVAPPAPPAVEPPRPAPPPPPAATQPPPVLPPQAPPAAPPPPATGEDADGVVTISEQGPRARVHLAPSTRMYRRMRGEWVLVCVSPCDRALPIRGPYQLANGARRTDDFHIAAPEGGGVELAVSGTSTPGTVVSALGVATGASLFYAAILTNSSKSRDTQSGLLAASVTVSLASVVGFALSSRTTLDMTSSPAGRSPPAPAKDAFLRGPAWSAPGSSSADAGAGAGDAPRITGVGWSAVF